MYSFLKYQIFKSKYILINFQQNNNLQKVK